MNENNKISNAIKMYIVIFLLIDLLQIFLSYLSLLNILFLVINYSAIILISGQLYKSIIALFELSDSRQKMIHKVVFLIAMLTALSMSANQFYKYSSTSILSALFHFVIAFSIRFGLIYIISFLLSFAEKKKTQ